MYEFTIAFYNRFLANGMAKEQAAREAVRISNNMSGTLSSNSFGREGDILQAIFFARNFTWSFLNNVTGAVYPLWRHWHGYKTGKLSLLNSLMHSDVSKATMDRQWKYYLSHMARTLFWKMTFITLAQYALMAWWKKDHPEDVEEKDLWTFMNWKDPGKFGMVKTPWKDPGQSTIYIDPLVWREISQFINLFPPLGKGAGSYIKNKLNWGVRTTIEQVANADYAGAKITDDTGSLAWDTIMAQRLSHMGASALPTFIREVPKINPFWGLTEAVGMSLKRGFPAERGVDIQDALEFRKFMNVENWKDKQIQDLVYTATPDELRMMLRKGILKPDQYVNALFRRKAPVFYMKKTNKTKLFEFFSQKKDRKRRAADIFQNTD